MKYWAHFPHEADVGIRGVGASKQEAFEQAAIARWLFSMFGASGVTGLNLYSLAVAVVGAIVVLVAYHAIRRAA